ncbi:hypothetical protein [Caldithrix abyssi]
MKKCMLGISLLLAGISFTIAQGVEFNGYMRNSVYAYSAPEEIGSDKTELHTRLYQTLSANVIFNQLGGWQLHLAGRALTDLADSELDNVKRFRAYRLSISKKNLFNMFDLEIGRQFLHPGVTLGSLDGLNLNIKPLKWFEWQVYGGVETHLLRAAKVYAVDEAAVFGTQLKFKRMFKSNISLVYLQKNAQSETQWQLAGINFSNYSIKHLLVLTQAHYDLVNNRLHRLYLSARYQFSPKLLINAYVKQQYPQIYNTSYFQIFEVDRYLLSGFNVVYQLTDQYAITGMMQGVQLKEGYGNRFIAMLSDRHGSFGLVYETGDLGDQMGALFNYRYRIMRELTLNLSIDYTRYRFEKRYDYENQLANAVGLSYRFLKHWNIQLEYQWLQNADFKSDQRVLNHISFVW